MASPCFPHWQALHLSQRGGSPAAGGDSMRADLDPVTGCTVETWDAERMRSRSMRTRDATGRR